MTNGTKNGVRSKVAQIVSRRIHPKLEQIMQFIDGIATLLQHKLLAQIIDHIDDMTKHIADMDD